VYFDVVTDQHGCCEYDPSARGPNIAVASAFVDDRAHFLQAETRIFVAITDNNWYQLHASRTNVDEVNFWRPSPTANFVALHTQTKKARCKVKSYDLAAAHTEVTAILAIFAR
jgi:hypothetical protein